MNNNDFVDIFGEPIGSYSNLLGDTFWLSDAGEIFQGDSAPFTGNYSNVFGDGGLMDQEWIQTTGSQLIFNLGMSTINAIFGGNAVTPGNTGYMGNAGAGAYANYTNWGTPNSSTSNLSFGGLDKLFLPVLLIIILIKK